MKVSSILLAILAVSVVSAFPLMGEAFAAPVLVADSAKVIGPNMLEIKFSDATRLGTSGTAGVTFTPENNGDDTTPRPVQSAIPRGTTVTITLSGDPLGTSATGSISDGIVITDRNDNDPSTNNLALGSQAFTDGQKPKVESAKITGPRQVIIEFSEPVTIAANAANFVNFQLTGSTTYIGVISAEASTTDGIVTLAMRDDIPTEATGTIKINKLGTGTDITVRDVAGNAMDTITSQPVQADQIPTVESAKITSPTQVTIKFSKAVTVLNDPTGSFNFSSFVVAGEHHAISAVDGTGTDTITLTVRGPIPTDATGTINMKPTFSDATPPVPTGLFATVGDEPVAAVALDNYTVTDGQAPTIMEDYPKNTGPKEITIKFSEPVKANRTHFDDIEIPVGRDERKFTVTGTGTDTITLKIGGDVVSDIIETVGTMSISNKITDLADTALSNGATLTDGFFTDIDINAGQAPTVESAKITAGKTIVVTFSTQVDQLSPGAFNFSYGNRALTTSAIDSELVDAKSVVTLTIVSATALPANATGSIKVNSTVRNSVTFVPIDDTVSYMVDAGQIPRVESAKITDSNQITIVFTEAIDDTTNETITSATFDNHFKNFRLTGGTDITIGDTRALAWIDAESANDDKTEFTFTIEGSELPTDATGAIDLTNIKDNDTPQIRLDNRDRTLGWSVTDGQNPTIDSIRITAPNTITVKSSEPINASLDNFADFTLASGDDKNIAGISVDMGEYDDTIELTIGGSGVASDASGTIEINPTKDDNDKSLTLIDEAGNEVEFAEDGAAESDDNVMSGTAEVEAGQVPELMDGYPKITGPNEVTIMFTTEVDATRAAFTDFIVDGENGPREINTIAGSGTDTITLTVGGDEIAAEKEGTISIDGTIVGSNSEASFEAQDANVVAGQAPMVVSAKVTSPYQIEIEFSDSVGVDSAASFTSLKINSDSTAYTVANPSASGNTVTLDVTREDDDGAVVNAELKHDATGTIQIGKEAVSNSISGVPNDIIPSQIIADGQAPQVKSAKVTDNNTATIEFTEAVNVEITDFEVFTIDGETVPRVLTLMDGSGTDTIILQVGGETLESDASAAMNIKTTIEDLAGNTLDETTQENYPVEAGQIPMVKEDGVVVSSPNTITITFTEPVNAELGDFTQIIIPVGNTRTLASIDGSGTDTIVLTISTTKASELNGIVSGSLVISDTITDRAGNTLQVGESTPIIADPEPKVESAKITGFNIVTIKFSEPITAVPGDFVNFKIVVGGVSENRAAIIHESQLVDGKADTDTIILFVSGDPIPIGTAGTINLIPSDFTAADATATPPVTTRTYDSLIDKNGQVINFNKVVPDSPGADFVYGIVDYPVEDDQSEPSNVSGTVTDSDGNTISGAFVTINTDPEMNTVTNSAGVYTFGEIPAGIYEITAVTPRDGATARSITIPSGDYDFALAPDSLISGTVTDTNDDGIPGVTVRILGSSFATVTNDDGMYSFNESPLGDQQIYVTVPDGYVRVGAFITPVTVVEGENQTVNFTFRSTAPVTPTSGTVSGIVTSAGSPVSGASVSIGSLSTSTSSSGSYTIANVPIGTSTISVSAAGYNDAVRTVTVIAGQDNAADISLTLIPTTSNGGTLFGTITNSVTNVTIPGVSGAINTTPTRQFTTDSSGVFIISNIPAGSYTITAVGDDYNENSRIVTVTSSQIINASFSLTPVDVPVTPTTGTVSGTVMNSATNELISGATITVVGTSLNASTNDAGSYTILQVPEGTYRLSVTSSGYTGGSGSVTVTADTTSTMNFSLTPVTMPGETNRVIGVVLDSSTGNMVSGATLTLSNNMTVTTQSSGAFQFSNVPVGSYALTVNAQGYNEYTDSDVEVTVGLPTSLRISLEPVAQPATVQVTVTDSNDASPISGATVTLGGNTATTGANGMSTFNNVPAGDYTVSATATGYERGTASVTATAGST